MDQKTYDAYDKIIKNTVYNYLRARGLNTSIAEDTCQDCWMQILEYEKSHGKFPDYALAKTIAQRRTVDSLRREYGKNAHFSLDRTSDDSSDEGAEDHSSWLRDYSNRDNFDAELNALKDMFPEGTKERTFLDFYIAKSGVGDGVIPDKTRSEDGYTDSNLAKMLGFKGTADRGWKKFRDRMKELIADYYGKQ